VLRVNKEWRLFERSENFRKNWEDDYIIKRDSALEKKPPTPPLRKIFAS